MERFEKQILSGLNQILDSPITTKDLEIPSDPNLGDFAFPCFHLAKRQKKNPAQIAKDLAENLKTLIPGSIEISTLGAYLNFKIKPHEAISSILASILEEDGLGHYGELTQNTRNTWVIEYSSPNIMKAFLISHLRSTALGAALSRIGRFRGFQVISINHLGDWGTQFGKLAIAIKLYGQHLPAKPTIHDLVNLYVRFHKEAEKDPTLEDQAREAFLKLEQDDPEITAFWKQCVETATCDFKKIYEKLSVHFDYYWGESFYKHLLTPMLESLKRKKLLIESEGAWIVPLTDEFGKDLTPCILQKKDGATIYATRDVAAAIYRYEKLRFHRMSYIVGTDQKLHFQQVFSVLKKIGHTWASNCEHIPFGMYRFKDAKMSTRQGNFVTFEEVLKLTQGKVKELMEQRTLQITFNENEKEEVSEQIALGALVFFDLRADPIKDIDFDLDRVTDFEGETGPYLQYAHTRCHSILRKAKESAPNKIGDKIYDNICFDPSLVLLLSQKEEILLIKVLGRFPLHLERALEFSKASQLANYLIDITKAFGAFYRECHVLGQEPRLTQARLILVEATRRILARGLSLLGIPLPKKM